MFNDCTKMYLGGGGVSSKLFLSAMLAAALLAACGSDGSDGQNGQNGTSAAVNTTIEPAGENCANGGIKIEVLEDGVVQSDKTQLICNGAAG